jgi:hypothetical protein
MQRALSVFVPRTFRSSSVAIESTHRGKHRSVAKAKTGVLETASFGIGADAAMRREFISNRRIGPKPPDFGPSSRVRRLARSIRYLVHKVKQFDVYSAITPTVLARTIVGIRILGAHKRRRRIAGLSIRFRDEVHTTEGIRRDVAVFRLLPRGFAESAGGVASDDEARVLSIHPEFASSSGILAGTRWRFPIEAKC